MAKHNHKDMHNRCVYEHLDGTVYCDYEEEPKTKKKTPRDMIKKAERLAAEILGEVDVR